MTAGYSNTTTFIPTTAAVSIASVTNGGGQTHTLELGGTGSGTILGDITVSNGGLNLLKSNASTWTLLGNSSYNGTTTINNGVLNIGNGGLTGTLTGGAVTNNATLNFNRSNTIVVGSTITGTGTINQNGTGSVVFTGTVGNPVNVNSGTLDGTGSIGATTVLDNPAIAVTNGNGGGGALTLASLTFDGSAAANVRTSSPGLIVTGALKTRNINPFGTVTVNPTPVSGIWADGANDLIKYGAGSVFGLGGGDVVLGALGGTLGPRQAVGGLFLRDTNGDTINDTIALLVNGDTPKWTGGVNNTWNTALNPLPRNWRLINAGTPTDFLTGDKVVFDDTANPARTSVDINAANVQVLNTTFNNSTLNYTILSSGGWGIRNWGVVAGTLTKNGSGSVTITTNNTYTGATTVNAGTLTLAGTNTSPSTTVGTGGTLQLDFSALTAPISDILANGSSLTLGCATLNVIASAAAFSSQTMGSTTLNAGGAAINVTGDRFTNPMVLNLGSITKNPGGTAIFTLPTGTQDGANGVTTTNGWTNSLLGTWAIISSPGAPSNGGTGGYTYATLGGTNVTPYISAIPENTSGGAWDGVPSGGDGTLNYDTLIPINNSQGLTRNFNSVRILAGGTQTGAATTTINGLMNAGTAPFTLSTPVAIGSSNDLILLRWAVLLRFPTPSAAPDWRP